MSINELTKKDVKTLMEELDRTRKEKLANRMSLKMRQAKDSHVMKQNAVKIAQIEMLLAQRNKEAANAPAQK